MASSALHADQRAADLQAVREGAEIDLLVVGPRAG